MHTRGGRDSNSRPLSETWSQARRIGPLCHLRNNLFSFLPEKKKRWRKKKSGIFGNVWLQMKKCPNKVINVVRGDLTFAWRLRLFSEPALSAFQISALPESPP